MFSSVDWKAYITFISCATVAWWVMVVLVFYRKKLFAMLSGSRKHNNRVEYVEEEPAPLPTTVEKADLLQTVQKVIAEIRLVFASVTSETPDEFIFSSLKTIIGSHKIIQQTEFQSALTDLIQSSVTRTGRKPLSKDELESIWRS